MGGEQRWFRIVGRDSQGESIEFSVPAGIGHVDLAQAAAEAVDATLSYGYAEIDGPDGDFLDEAEADEVRRKNGDWTGI